MCATVAHARVKCSEDQVTFQTIDKKRESLNPSFVVGLTCRMSGMSGRKAHVIQVHFRTFAKDLSGA